MCDSRITQALQQHNIIGHVLRRGVLVVHLEGTCISPKGGSATLYKSVSEVASNFNQALVRANLFKTNRDKDFQ